MVVVAMLAGSRKRFGSDVLRAERAGDGCAASWPLPRQNVHELAVLRTAQVRESGFVYDGGELRAEECDDRHEARTPNGNRPSGGRAHRR
jgi:hypothetical protein